jgi:antitoxin component YwqK of YwqJK toxin-antitoxin module
MRTFALAIVSALLLTLPLIAAQDENYLDYGIPADAIKRGPRRLRPDQDVIFYFQPGTDMTSTSIMATPTPDGVIPDWKHPEPMGKEWFNQNGVLVSRELFKNGVKHGVQRKWYPNGQLESEKPYKNGSMEGVFRVWDERGQLIAQYALHQGTGVVSVYNSSGQLAKNRHYDHNAEDGPQMERSEQGEIVLYGMKKGKTIGPVFGFFANGSYCYISFFSENGLRVGPYIRFKQDGSVQTISWCVDGLEVKESDYAAAAARDPKLPPYYSDITQYKQLAGPDVHALFEKYQKVPKVKIPLEFDPAGNPVPAP